VDLTVITEERSTMQCESGEQVAARRKEQAMDDKDERAKPGRALPRRWLASGGLVAAGLLAGGILAGTHIAGAASGSSNTNSASTAATRNADPATLGHGPGETLLTDGNASKVRAAALAAVPGGTIIRVETDSAGSPYEAHVRKSDGSIVTVKVDKSFKVTSIDSGFGGR